MTASSHAGWTTLCGSLTNPASHSMPETQTLTPTQTTHPPTHLPIVTHLSTHPHPPIHPPHLPPYSHPPTHPQPPTLSPTFSQSPAITQPLRILAHVWPIVFSTVSPHRPLESRHLHLLQCADRRRCRGRCTGSCLPPTPGTCCWHALTGMGIEGVQNFPSFLQDLCFPPVFFGFIFCTSRQKAQFSPHIFYDENDQIFTLPKNVFLNFVRWKNSPLRLLNLLVLISSGLGIVPVRSPLNASHSDCRKQSYTSFVIQVQLIALTRISRFKLSLYYVRCYRNFLKIKHFPISLSLFIWINRLLLSHR